MKAEVKKTIEKIRRGETTPRKYPEKEKKEEPFNQTDRRFVISSDEERRLLTKYEAVGNKKIQEEIKKGSDLFNASPDIAETNELKFFAQSFKDHIQFEDSDIEKEITEDEARIKIGEIYERIKYSLKRYVKLKEEYYDVVAVWVLGTYMMEEYNTYPYLFMNAQKGSGKTRMLKLLEVLVNDGILLASMREAVLFRLADKGHALLIDELEGLDRKENAPLKELLNACYKKGTKVFRMKKVGDEWDFESFEPFTPIAIANIGGVDDVLGDRVITVHLNKTSNPNFALLQEDYTKFDLIGNLEECNISSLCRLCSRKYGIASFNKYIMERYPLDLTYTTTTYTTLTTDTTPSTREKDIDSSVYDVYNRIIDSNIRGRHLELMLPLLFTSLMLNDDVFASVLKFGKELSKQKKEDDLTESKDVSLIEFVSKMSSSMNYTEYQFVHELNDKFRFFLGLRDDRQRTDINSMWFGRALKRLGLVVNKRRLAAGVEVELDIPKAIKLLGDMK